ncbi:MAG: TldD/PmbA family protein [Nitrospiraceae bacterium]|nr:TldD/PmbA family protein [Nitrospiraceae bacterium]
MIDTELLLALIREALAQGGEYADVFVESRMQTSIVLEDGKIEKVVTGGESGAGIRLIHKGKTSYAYSNDLSAKALLQAAHEAGRAASDGASGTARDLTVRRPALAFDVRLLPPSVPIGRKILLVRDADRAARRSDDRIRQVTAIYRDSVQKVRIANSEGFVADDERVYTTGVVQVIAAQDDVIQTGYETLGGMAGFELFDEGGLDRIALKAAARALMMLGAQKAPAGRMPVVISSTAGGTMIHEAIGHGLEADLARQKLSVFSDKIGKRVASPLVTVVDDSTLPGKRGSFRFDDEGTPSRRTVLVQDGILQCYLYDKLSSMKDGVLSTGNGRRESYRHRPIPRMTNTFIAEGRMQPEEVLRSLDRGLLVEKMGGGQVNTVTGDFVFDVQEGYLIEQGMKGEPVRGATLTGNGPGVLESIDMVANDLGFSIGTCGKDSQGVPVSDAMPTVRIPEIVVGGAHR